MSDNRHPLYPDYSYDPKTGDWIWNRPQASKEKANARSKARNRAHRQLAKMFPAEFQILLAEELERVNADLPE